MNKQELASLIWDYCNGLRGSISTVEYKDFILGFIFYRFLSEKEVEHLRRQRWTEEDMKEYLNESDQETVEECKSALGYFIEYKDLFSTWKADESFDITCVSEALGRFTRNIHSDRLPIYGGIFKSLSDKLPKLGTGNEAKSHIRKIVKIVSQIPMDGKQGYDVLGFIYEYLLANFASNAGKKDGEFYTPHEISVLMSEIIADHLKERDNINIFDPTSGSGSLLINIGQSVQKYLHSSDNIVYYAQEKIEDTYNLTRMNLIMRGVKPGNIFVRCGDTLAADWPYIDYNNCYKYVPVDCVVSNPPYSQKWKADEHENDPRYRRYGLAPSSKADYAFLLHDLYHLKDDGIMCIVLPHGVLFRGGTEKDIRQNLVESNNIETVIGLPANIFYGTGIPTIIMVLKKHRANSDILFIDASKEFYKDGSKNRLAGNNIKKIVDTVLSRESIPYFSRLVSKDEIIQNGYNLNIPRYISSTKEEMPYDINATIFGNLPIDEINQFNEWWSAFPSLKNQLFENINSHIARLKVDNLRQTILNNNEIKDFIAEFDRRFEGFDTELFERLSNKDGKNIYQLKKDITASIFEKCENLNLIDKYKVFQTFDDLWPSISIDLEMILANDGDLSICREIEDIEVYDKKNKETVTKGQQGKILPFELVQKYLYELEYKDLIEKENKLERMVGEFDNVFNELDEESRSDIIKEEEGQDECENKIDNKRLKQKYVEIIDSLDNYETKILSSYFGISKTKEKIEYEKLHREVEWPKEEEKSQNGTFSKSVLTAYINNIKNTIEISEEDDDYKIRKLYLLSQESSLLRKQIKDTVKILNEKVISDIMNLSNNQILAILKEKWVKPIIEAINKITTNLIYEFVNQLNKLMKKYDNPLSALNVELIGIEKEILPLINDLNGDSFDMEGLKELTKILGGELE